MTRAALLAAALVAAGCERAPSPAAGIGLRVPLPEGWRASAVASGLHAGPPGRAVLQLERTTRAFPDALEFLGAVEAEGAEVLHKESSETFIGVLYLISGRRAFVGVRQAGPTTIWCSTVPGATSHEVEAAHGVCRSLSWEADAPR